MENEVVRQLTSLVAACAVSSLAACASIPPEQPSLHHIAERNFVVGEEKQVNVGAAMLQVNDYWIEKGGYGGWQSPLTFTVGNGISQYGFSGGVTYPVVGRRMIEGQAYDILGSFMDPLLVDQSGRVAKVGASMGPLTLNLNDHPGRLIKFDNINVVKSLPFSKYELVYSGISGDTIRVAYREYSREDLARTAFFQDLTYNKGSPTIGFRDIEIEVLEANNGGIRFIVRRAP